MEEPTVDQQALPSDRAFVVQFRVKTDVTSGCFDGRIEHVASGQAALFHSLDELVTLLQTMLPPGGLSGDHEENDKSKEARRR